MRWWRSRFGADLLFEVAQLAALLALYKAVRYWSRDQLAAAYDNARHVISFERSLPVPSEVDLTSITMHIPAMVRFFNQYYVLAHFLVMFVFLTWMYVRQPERVISAADSAVLSMVISRGMPSQSAGGGELT